MMHPAVGERLRVALEAPVPDTVDAYLELMDEHLPDTAVAGLQAVRSLLERARAARQATGY